MCEGRALPAKESTEGLGQTDRPQHRRKSRSDMDVSVLVLACLCASACTSSSLRGGASAPRVMTPVVVGLPFAPGTAFTVSQGAFGVKSHSKPGNEYNWDLAVPFGTSVRASAGRSSV